MGTIAGSGNLISANGDDSIDAGAGGAAALGNAAEG